MSTENNSYDIAHIAGIYIDAPLDFTFQYLSNPLLLGNWALGCRQVKPTGIEDLFVGESLFDGSQAYFQIKAYRDLYLIDYEIGSQTKRVPRISIRLASNEWCDLSEDQCAVAMFAWRTRTMQTARWQQLIRAHECEILLVKAQIETLFHLKS